MCVLLLILDNLLKAKEKASVAEDTSDLASDYEGKRNRKKKKLLYDTNETQSASSDESLSDDGVTSPIKFPTPPKYKGIFYFFLNNMN